MSSVPASRPKEMQTERVTVSTTIDAAAEAVFAVLADPSAHAAIDGTGWVRGPRDGDRIIAAGQLFRMRMYHEGHPDRDSAETGQLSFGGWTWQRYEAACRVMR